MEIYEKCLFSFALLFICRGENLHMKGRGNFEGQYFHLHLLPPTTNNFILSNVMLSFGVIVRSNRAEKIDTDLHPSGAKEKRAIVSPQLSSKSSFAGFVYVVLSVRILRGGKGCFYLRARPVC